MTTTVATSTAQIRGGCRHEPDRSVSTPPADRPTDQPTHQPTRSTVGVRPVPGPDAAELAAQAWPIIELTDLLVGVPDVPCRDGDAELWFAESPQDVEFAKSLCGTCPVRGTCLQGALARREPWGVWGGELFVMGQVVPRKRPRGRPRKDAVA